MKKKYLELEWNVFNINPNTSGVIKVNILNEEIIKEIDKKFEKTEITTLKQLEYNLDKYFRYKYASRAECEYLIGNMFESDVEKFIKQSMYNQIEINIKQITEYVNMKMDLKLK